MTEGESELGGGGQVAVRRVPKLSALDNDTTDAWMGSTVKLHGWIYSVRTQGAGTLVFFDLGDGSTVTPTRCLAAQAPAVEDEAAGDPQQLEQKQQQYWYNSTNLLQESGSTDDEAEYSKLSFDDLTQTTSLSIGCSVMMFGRVTEPPPGTTQRYEIRVLELYAIGGVADAVRYPIQKSILKKPVALRSQYHARFRAPIVQQLMRIRSEALFAIHEFFHQEGVPLLDPNIMTSSDCEGAGEVFKITPQFFNTVIVNATTAAAAPPSDGTDAAAEAPAAEPAVPASTTATFSAEVGLTVSSQLPLEAIAMGTGAVYTCQKSFRAEKSDTNKHLAEFLHVEYEEYFITLTDLIDQAERYVKHVIRTVVDRCQAQYAFLDGKATAPEEFHGHRDYLVSLLDKPFVRIKHADAIDAMLADLRDKVQVTNAQGKQAKLKFKIKPEHGEDLGSEHEKYLVQKYGTFVFVTHWPSSIKSFYMKQVGDGTCESFDLLAPLVGELFGGSMREWRYEQLQAVMTAKHMDFAPLQWFVDLRKDGTAPHGGWGMGFDRLVMFLTNANSVRDVVPYPVYYGHCPY